MASDEINLMLFAGELSTQDNLKHLHPELVAQIVKQVWPVAYTQGRADAWRWIPVSERQPEKSGKYLVSAFDGDQGSSLDYYADYKGWNINWLTSSREHEMFPTHWMELPPAPIKLPGGEND